MKLVVRWSIEKIVGYVLLAAAFGVAACAGRSERRTGGDDQAGTSGTNSTGGAGGTGGGQPCTWDGVVYPHGSSFPSPDGCNTCFCDDASVSCTLVDCPPPERCDELGYEYEETLVIAKQCDPEAENQCSGIVPSGIVCGCPTSVTLGSATDALGPLEMEASALGCGTRVTCGACAGEMIQGVCSAEGTCVDVFLNDCESIREGYHQAFARADRCKPGDSGQCQVLEWPDPGCGCPTHTNQSDELRQLSLAWATLGCGNGEPCHLCPAPGPAGACGDDGTCTDVYPL
jgi:hypothetical protein